MERQLQSQLANTRRFSATAETYANLLYGEDDASDFKSGLLLSFMDIVTPGEKWKRRERRLQTLSRAVRRVKREAMDANSPNKSSDGASLQRSPARDRPALSRSSTPNRAGAGAPRTAWYDDERTQALLSRRPRSTVLQEPSGSVGWAVAGDKPGRPALPERPASQASIASTRPSSTSRT